MENLTAHTCSSDPEAVPAQLNAAHIDVQPRVCSRCAHVQSVKAVVPATVDSSITVVGAAKQRQ